METGDNWEKRTGRRSEEEEGGGESLFDGEKSFS